MKTLYLIYKSCSKGFIKEVFLIFQITIVIILLNTAITPFVNYYQVEHVVTGGMPNNSVYYSRPTFFNEQEKDTDPFKAFVSDERVAAICITYRTYGNVNGQDADILLYNKEMFKFFSPVLSSGKWHYNTSGIFLNASLMEYVGSQNVSVEINNNTIVLNCDYEVLGTTNSKDIVYCIDVGGSQPEISQIGVNFDYIRNTSTEHTPFLAIIPFDFESNPNLLSSVGGAVIVTKEGIDDKEFISDIPDSTYSGHLYLLSELIGNSWNRLIGTYKIDALLSILLSISAVFGISGYTYLKTKSLQKQMGIYKICGCRNATYSKIILLTNLAIVAISSLFAFWLRDIIILGEGNDSAASFLISVGFIVFVCILPIVITIISSRRLSFSELLYFGD